VFVMVVVLALLVDVDVIITIVAFELVEVLLVVASLVSDLAV